MDARDRYDQPMPDNVRRQVQVPRRKGLRQLMVPVGTEIDSPEIEPPFDTIVPNGANWIALCHPPLIAATRPR
jgi:hypothetical protein